MEYSRQKGHRGKENKVKQSVVKEGAMMQDKGPQTQDRVKVEATDTGQGEGRPLSDIEHGRLRLERGRRKFKRSILFID